MSDFAKESGHWYTAEGEPAYEVENKSKGGMRPTTIRDARKLGLLPSVTSILGVVAKPGLERWKIDQGIMAALTSPALHDYMAGEMSDEQLIRRINEDAKAQAKAAAERGTEIHGWIEKYMRGGAVEGIELEYAEAVFDAMIEAIGLFTIADVDCEKSVASPEYGYGGKVDFVCRRLNVVADFKTKDGDVEGVKAYPEQAAQLAAYAYAMGMPDATLVNVFVSRDQPKAIVHIWTREEAEYGWRLFKSSLDLWKIIKKW